MKYGCGMCTLDLIDFYKKNQAIIYFLPLLHHFVVGVFVLIFCLDN